MIEEKMKEKDDAGRGTATCVTEKGPELNNCHSKCYPTSNASPLPAHSQHTFQQPAEGSLHLSIFMPRDECKTVVLQAMRLQIPRG